MARRSARAVLLAAAVAATALPAAAAVTCGSYASPAQCDGKVTDTGHCGWRDRACVAVAPLEEGMVAVTSVGGAAEEPRFAITSSTDEPAVAEPAAAAPTSEGAPPRAPTRPSCTRMEQ